MEAKEGKENADLAIGETAKFSEDSNNTMEDVDPSESPSPIIPTEEQSSSVVSNNHGFSEENNDGLGEHSGDMNVSSAFGGLETSSSITNSVTCTRTDDVGTEKNTLMTHESEISEGCMDITEPNTNEKLSTVHTQDVVDCKGAQIQSPTLLAGAQIQSPALLAGAQIQSPALLAGAQIQSPALLAGTEFGKENYLRGCKWSADGGKLLTTANDNKFYVYDFEPELCTQDRFSEMKFSKVIHETGTVYDFCWYNQTSYPRSCSFLASSKDSPVHMWDSNSGELISSYRAYDQMDELTTAHSLCCSWDGSKIYCGFRKMIRVFDTNRPGRECESRSTYVGKVGGQNGIISCLASSAHGGLYAAGSYSRSIGLYYEAKGEAVCVFEGQQGGVTHMAFSPDGTKLFSGGRKDPEILCWDLRNPGQILFVAVRKVETNQRIYFDLDSTGRYLISGNHDGMVTLWDTLQPPTQSRPDTDFVLQSCQEFRAHNDTVNGISFHPSQPVLATSSGQRHSLPLDDESLFTNVASEENALKLWLHK